MKKFQVSIQISVEMEDDTTDLGGVINALSYVPSMVGATARLTGINVYEDHQPPMSTAIGGPPLVERAATSAALADSSEDSIPADDEAADGPFEER